MKRYLSIAAILLGQQVASAVNPYTDPGNTGNWLLNSAVSDEFEGTQLDEVKWLIQGRNGEYRSNFRGRAPSQFSTDNVRVEGGMLKLETRWEPDYPFNPTVDANGDPYENITTAAVITRQQFLYGYMEIKCKAADADITSSFWTTGSNAELDVFEATGGPAPAKQHLTNEMWSSIHDWSYPPPNSVWTEKHYLPFAFADGFHVYGCEWDTNYINFYADGQLITQVTKAQLGADWVMDGPQWVWVDQETFPWRGLPVEADLPVDYEIEYIRVWQRGPPPPPSPWLNFVALYGLSGVKTANVDFDILSDWGEYVFDGDPTNSVDVGVIPAFDAATGDYTFDLRNDAGIVAHVVTKTDMTAPAWSTNETILVTSNDGTMATHVSSIGTSEPQLFIALMVDETNAPAIPGAAGFEAESGVLGTSYDPPLFDATALGGQYIAPEETSTGNSPASSARVATYSVTLGAGTYDLYVRHYVGPSGGSDDSVCIGNGFGTKAPGVNGDWIRVNGLDQAFNAYVDPEGTEIVNGTWTWMKYSGQVTDRSVPQFTTTGGAETFMIGSREDGFRIDAMVFVPNGVTPSSAELSGAVTE